jgi:Rrf2 family protein
MIGISRQTDYAARLVLHLASLEPDTQVSIAEVAERRLVPEPFLRRIVRKLVVAGLVATVRGVGGGIRLACPAEDVSLLDVVRAIEGGVVLNRCVNDPPVCPLADVCPVQRQWTRITANLEADLLAVRFSDLAPSVERRVTTNAYPSADRAGDEAPARPSRRND